MPQALTDMPWWIIAACALVAVVLAVAGLRAALAGRRREPGRLHGGYLLATVLIAAVALALILVAFTMSYAALYASATWLANTDLHAINDGDLRFLFPIGIDAVIVYFLAMDLVMEWQGRRHPLNRWAAYGLSAVTIILNVAQGEGGTASYLGHAGPPVVIILIAEGVAAWVRHLAGLAHGQSADRIPFGRWVAHPLSTLKVARLMLGWGVGSYPDALAREQRRQLAYAMLREQYGRAWRRSTPRHLKWMLDNGYELDTAFELTRAMTAGRVAMSAAEADALGGLGGLGGRPRPTAIDTGMDMASVDRAHRVASRTEVAGMAATAATAELASPSVERLADETPAEVAAADNGRPPGQTDRTETAAATSAAETRPAPVRVEEPVFLTVAEPDSSVRREDAEEKEDGSDETNQEDEGRYVRSRSSALGHRLSPQEKRQRVRQLLESVPDITDEEIAGEIGVAARTARRYRSEIMQEVRATADFRMEEAEDGQPRLVHAGRSGQGD